MTTAGNDTASTREDEILRRVYQQMIEVQAKRYAVGYDAAAGLERFSGWLRDHATAEPEPDADQAVLELYTQHYQSLIRLAAMLVRDTATAEEIVQDAFVAFHAGWSRLGDTEQALAHLRQTVVNKSRSVLRHRAIADKNPSGAPYGPGAAGAVGDLLTRDATVAALRRLPAQQREAILLRFYADMPEDEIATTMGISRGAVKSHTARGMAALRAALEESTSAPDRPENSGHGPATR
jgi:RNA polymerase sigma-70 factor (sigma-E family)